MSTAHIPRLDRGRQSPPRLTLPRVFPRTFSALDRAHLPTGNTNVPVVYRDPEHFLRILLDERIAKPSPRRAFPTHRRYKQPCPEVGDAIW